jgi:ankyrin repeat protein
MSAFQQEPEAAGDVEVHPPAILHEHVQGEIFIETFFAEGPLGVTLRRRPDDGIVFIHEIIPDSQAVNLDVSPLDELWAIGDSEVGETPLDKDAWNGLISFIKNSSRPLRIVWRRKPKADASPAVINTPTPITPSVPASSPPSAAVVTPNTAPAIVAPKIDVPPEYAELQRIVSRLVPKEDSKASSRKINPQSLLIEGRKVLKQGELSVLGKNSLWGSKKYEKRRVILCNDIFIIAIPQGGNVAALEYVLDLPTCKIRSLGHVFGAVGEATDPMAEGNASGRVSIEDLVFDLIAPPMGEITFVGDSKEIKDVWVLTIFLAICDNVGDSERVLGWRHQYMLGTMHSAVICRDEHRIRELIGLCNDGRLSFLSIEQPDEEGYTPLHYACIMRLHTIIDLLHQATADVTATDRQGLTPLHWAAMQLDDYALSLLCQHVFDLDLPDPKDRTPLTICVLEGRDIHGKTDPVLLKDCLTHMLSHKPNCHWADKQGRTLIHYLAASWQFEALEVLLDTDAVDVNAMDIITGMTPLHYAVQARPIKKAVGEAQRIMNRWKLSTSSTSSSSSVSTGVSPRLSASASAVTPAANAAATATAVLLQEPEPLHTPYGVDTIRALLKAGAKPNIRDGNGRTPLGLLLTDLEAQDRWLDREEILPAIAILISFGARVDLDPAGAASLKNLYPDLMVAAFVEKWTSMPVIDCGPLGVGYVVYVTLATLNYTANVLNGRGVSLFLFSFRANHFEVLDLAAGATQLTTSSRTDSSGNLAGMTTTAGAASGGSRMSVDRRTSTAGVSTVLVDGNAASTVTPTKHPFAPDGSKQCELCGFVYTLFRRQHHCRLCNASCCDDCSKKRSVLECTQARTCDVCINRLHHLQEKAQEEARALQRSQSNAALNSGSGGGVGGVGGSGMGAAAVNGAASNNANGGFASFFGSSNISSNAAAEQAASDRDRERRMRLFGSASQKAESTAPGGAASQQQQQQQATVNSQASVGRTMQTMNEVHERLQERGEKLSRMSHRTEEMANQANEFARLAKMLNEQQKSRWF